MDLKPHERMNWRAMADEAFHRHWLRQAPIGRWRGFFGLVKEDRRFWSMAGYFLHTFARDAQETKVKLTAHLPGPSRLWTLPILHLKRLAVWCSKRSEKPSPAL